MAHIGFHCTQECGLIIGTAPADDAAERVGFDRVTQYRARAVCLDVVDGPGIDPGVLVRLAQHRFLRVRVGREHPIGPAVMVDRAARDDRKDFVAVAAGVGDSLEYQHPAALGTGITIGVLRERLDSAVGRQHATDLIEADRDQRGDQCIDTAGDDNIGVTRAERLDTFVHGDQRRRAGGVDGHRWAAEIIEVGHPVGDDRACRSGDCVGMRDRGVRHRQEAVVVERAADVDADVTAAQTRGRNPGLFQGFPGQFQGHPLLRIDVVGFHLRQREELGVKALDVGQVAAAGVRFGDPLGDARLVQKLRPPALRQVGDRVTPLEEGGPHLVGSVHIPRKAGGHPHDRNIEPALFDLVCVARPVLGVQRRGIHLGFALDDDRGQRLDGRVSERDCGGQRDPGEILDVAGHRDGVTRRQAQLDHRYRFADRIG